MVFERVEQETDTNLMLRTTAVEVTKLPLEFLSCHLTGYVWPTLPVFVIPLSTGGRKPMNV